MIDKIIKYYKDNLDYIFIVITSPLALFFLNVVYSNNWFNSSDWGVITRIISVVISLVYYLVIIVIANYIKNNLK